MLSSLTLQVTGCIGFVLVVTMGVIASPIRNLWAKIFSRWPAWAKMITCAMCFGVWAGSGWGAALLFRPFEPAWFIATHDVLAFAFTVSFFGFLVALFDHAVGGLGSLKMLSLPKSKPSLFRPRRSRR
jgi:hypothetical protein